MDSCSSIGHNDFPDPKKARLSNRLKSYSVIVYIDINIRKFLGMKSHENKFKILLKYNPVTKELLKNIETMSDIVTLISNNVPLLVDKSYLLQYSIKESNNSEDIKHYFPFENANGISTVFASAVKNMCSLSLFIEPSVDFPPIESVSSTAIPDPTKSDTYSMVSFYRFNNVPDPSDLAHKLEILWKPFLVVGRVYVAEEGVNAQLSLPTNVLSNFFEVCRKIPIFEDQYFNVDHTLTVEKFNELKPFKSLHIRVRNQALADGLAEKLDLTRSGIEISPLEWHNTIGNPKAVILDCRNSYESDVGKFQNATPLNTTYFRESWNALDDILRDTPKDTPIMTYCTGGIRCVKINAYLEQKMGYQNVGRLHGGIIAYARELEQQTTGTAAYCTSTAPASGGGRNIADSKFNGVNYVFDNRVGARITSDVFTKCQFCLAACDSWVNCRNIYCQIPRIIQCGSCRLEFNGCCSEKCMKFLEGEIEVEEVPVN